MQNFKEIEDLVISSGLKSDADQQERILADAFAALDRIKETRSINKQEPVRKRPVRYKWAELATAAAIIVAVFTALWYFNGSIDGSTVAWAQVADKVSQIDTFTYRQRALNDKIKHGETVHYFSRQYGLRLGTYNNEKINMRKFFLPADKIVVTIMPQEKKYTQTPLTPNEYDQMQRFHDPRKLIEQFMSGQYTQLGCRTIDGVFACGIETKELNLTDSMLKNTVGRLWVNANTSLPVRMEIEGIADDENKIKIVTDEFRWDAKLQAADFAPEIAPDYKLNGQKNEN